MDDRACRHKDDHATFGSGNVQIGADLRQIMLDRYWLRRNVAFPINHNAWTAIGCKREGIGNSGGRYLLAIFSPHCIEVELRQKRATAIDAALNGN